MRRISGQFGVGGGLMSIGTSKAKVYVESDTKTTFADVAGAPRRLPAWILGEILKGYWHNGRRVLLYFYRDKDGKEIDFLIVQDGTVYPWNSRRPRLPERTMSDISMS